MAKRSRDFTTGSPAKQLLIFALPLIASMILQNLYNTADAVIVGRFVGQTALAAVGAAGSLTRVILMFVSGTTQGMAIIVSQFYGAKDETSLKKTIATTLYIMVGLSLVLGTLGPMLARELLQAIRVPADVLDDAIVYLRIILAGTIFTGFYNMANFLARSLGDSLTPTLVLVITSILNVGLNLLFVLTFQMGVAGVAYATVLATFVSAIVCWAIVWKKMPVVRPTAETLKPESAIVKMVVRMGLPSALQYSMVSIGALSVQTMVNVFGSTVMAAYSAGTKIEALVSFPPGGVTQAMQIFTGQNVGAGRDDRVRSGFKAGLAMIAMYSVFSGLLMIFGGRTLMGIFTKEAGELVQVGHRYLVISGLGVFSLGLLYLSRSTLVGAGDAAAGAYISLFELGLRIVAAYLLSHFTSLGYMGVFMGGPISWTVAGLYSYVRYRRGDWMSKRLTGEAKPA
jgi:putative MATE family efflux protein